MDGTRRLGLKIKCIILELKSSFLYTLKNCRQGTNNSDWTQNQYIVIGDPTVFKLKVESTYSKPLERQVTEGIAITNSTADRMMNSKSEYLQPAVPRVQTTREVRDHGPGS